MPRLVHMIGAASVGKAFFDAFLLRRFLSNVTAIGVFAIIGSIMLGALLLGGCYALMRLLIHYGLDADVALVTVGGIVALMAVISALLAVNRIRKLRESLLPLAPVASELGDVANAFIDGLRGK